jgi:hypothetical protein
LLHSLEKTGKILSVEDVFQRSYKKFNERLDAVNIQEAEKA